MYSFSGANHNLRRKRVRERTKLYSISTIVMGFSLCLAQQAQAGAVSISNRNCAWQGLSRTNQAKFQLRGTTWFVPGKDKIPRLDEQCSSDWITLHVGRTQTLQVETSAWIRGMKLECNYVVEPEGGFLSTNWVMGKDVSKYVCEQDWIGICQCKTQ